MDLFNNDWARSNRAMVDRTGDKPDSWLKSGAMWRWAAPHSHGQLEITPRRGDQPASAAFFTASTHGTDERRIELRNADHADMVVELIEAFVRGLGSELERIS